MASAPHEDLLLPLILWPLPAIDRITDIPSCHVRRAGESASPEIVARKAAAHIPLGSGDSLWPPSVGVRRVDLPARLSSRHPRSRRFSSQHNAELGLELCRVSAPFIAHSVDNATVFRTHELDGQGRGRSWQDGFIEERSRR